MERPSKQHIKSRLLPPWLIVGVGDTVTVRTLDDVMFVSEGELDLTGRRASWDQYQQKVYNLDAEREQVLYGNIFMWNAIVDALEDAGFDYDDPEFYKNKILRISHPDKMQWIVKVKKEKGKESKAAQEEPKNPNPVVEEAPVEEVDEEEGDEEWY